MSCRKLFVEEDKYPSFLEERAAAILRGKHVDAFCEVISLPYHNAFVDLEIYLPPPSAPEVTREDMVDITAILQSGYASLDTSNISNTSSSSRKRSMTAIVLTADNTMTEKGLKVGMHVIFPYLACTIEDEHTVRRATLPRLQSFLDARFAWCDPPLSAASIYDESPYAVGKGLRMIRAHKTRPDKSVEPCPVKGRSYDVAFVVSEGGKVADQSTLMLRGNLAMASQRCSIRRSGAATSVACEIAAKRKRQGHDSVARGLTSGLLPQEFYVYAGKIDESFLTCRVIDIKPKKNFENLTRSGVELVLDDHKYCPCKGGFHSTSKLFLFLSEFGILHAGCWSPRHPYWHSLRVPLPQRILRPMRFLRMDGFPVGFL